MKDQILLSVKDASQFLFGDFDRTHQDRTRRLINQLELQKIVIGKKHTLLKKS